jgi:hypothetical protein
MVVKGNCGCRSRPWPRNTEGCRQANQDGEPVPAGAGTYDDERLAWRLIILAVTAIGTPAAFFAQLANAREELYRVRPPLVPLAAIRGTRARGRCLRRLVLKSAARPPTRVGQQCLHSPSLSCPIRRSVRESSAQVTARGHWPLSRVRDHAALT